MPPPPRPLVPTACGPIARPRLPGPDLPGGRRRPTTSAPPGRRSSPRSTRSRAASARTSAPPRPARWAGCSSCPRPGRPTASTPTATATRTPTTPNDAIFAAARYLRAAGMPEDPEGAVFAYNHADWYVAEVMARAACFSGIGNGAIGGLSLIPKRQELVCAPADGRPGVDPRRLHEGLPGRRRPLRARADAGSGRSPRWPALESNFGKGMSSRAARLDGPARHHRGQLEALRGRRRRRRQGQRTRAPRTPPRRSPG